MTTRKKANFGSQRFLPSKLLLMSASLATLYSCGVAVPEKPNPPENPVVAQNRSNSLQPNAFARLSSSDKAKQLKRFIQIQNTEKLFILGAQRPSFEKIQDPVLRDAYWDLSRNCEISRENLSERLNGLSTELSLTVSRNGSSSADGGSCPAEYIQKVKPFVNILSTSSGKIVDKAKILIDYRLNSTDQFYDKFLSKMRLDGEAEKHTEIISDTHYRIVIREKYDGLIHSRAYGLSPAIKRVQSVFDWDNGKLTRSLLIQVWSLQIGNETLEFRTEREIGANKNEVGINRLFIDGKEISSDDQLQLVTAGGKK